MLLIGATIKSKKFHCLKNAAKEYAITSWWLPGNKFLFVMHMTKDPYLTKKCSSSLKHRHGLFFFNFFQRVQLR